MVVDVEKAFENVKLEQTVFSYCKGLPVNSYVGRRFVGGDFTTATRIPNDLVLKLRAWVCSVTQKELEIVSHVRHGKVVYLRDISKNKRGVPLQSYLAESGDYPIIGGVNILRYGCEGAKGFLDKTALSQNQRKLSFLTQLKILSQNIVAHVQRPYPHLLIASTYDREGTILSLDTVNNTVLTKSGYAYEYILAVLNARFTSM
ncbi:MAG: hypothetical protein HYX84_08310 [Chloroflexi bacterium]|nr:hypothetical protein [Chloroflexota bacterium]